MRYPFPSITPDITDLSPGSAQPAIFVEAADNEVELHVSFTQPVKLSSSVHRAGDTIVNVYGVDLMLFAVHMDRTLVCICVNPAEPGVLDLLKSASASRKLVYVFSNPGGKAVRIKQDYSLPVELEGILQRAQENAPSDEKFYAAYSLFVMTGGSKEMAAARSQPKQPIKQVINALVDPFTREPSDKEATEYGASSCGTMH